MALIHFEKANLCHQNTIFQWLEEPHMKEFWDNSQEHKDDIRIFINGRVEKSPYFDGIFTYWVGSLDHEPFCFILTGEVAHDKDYPDAWNQNRSHTGTTVSIDFGIGNKDFLGKGFAAPALKTFTEFFKEKIDPATDTFFIDPNDNNLRAKHVYEKAGFKTVAELPSEGRYHTFSSDKTYLMIKKMPSQTS